MTGLLRFQGNCFGNYILKTRSRYHKKEKRQWPKGDTYEFEQRSHHQGQSIGRNLGLGVYGDDTHDELTRGLSLIEQIKNQEVKRNYQQGQTDRDVEFLTHKAKIPHVIGRKPILHYKIDTCRRNDIDQKSDHSRTFRLFHIINIQVPNTRNPCCRSDSDLF